MKCMPALWCKWLIIILISSGWSFGCPGNQGLLEPGGGSGAVAVDKQPERVEPLTVVAWSGKFDQGWKEYDRLVKEQKFEQAAKSVEDMLEKAKSTGKSEEWVRGLIRFVQLRTALHGYEKSVRFFREQPWPEDLLSSAVLHLFYAQSLVQYARSYSWEIRKRERVDSKGVVDLKAWTLDQIYEEAQRAYQKVWQHRQQLGKHAVTSLSEYVQANNYPRQIRPTLRDAVSYLWVEMLADTSGWRPEHSNEVYRLDLGKMLSQPAPVSLTDPAVHPLLKICAVLDDLEQWHRARGEAEAHFETRLTRLRNLHAHFKREPDRARLRADLRERLPSMRKLAWWSMGMNVLAEFVRAEQTADNLIRARKIALDGQQAYPESIGGMRCHHLVKSIEMPDFRPMAMASDGPGKRSIGIQHKNLGRLYFRAYRLDLKKQIESARDYNLYPQHDQLQKLIDKSTPSKRWQADLAATPDYKMHRSYVVPPMDRPGFYVVVFSATKDFAPKQNKLQALFMVVGDLVLLSRQLGDRVEVEILSGQTGRPISGAKVHLYRFDYKRGHRSVASRVTGKDGRVVLKKKGSHSYFLFAQKRKQVAIDPQNIYLNARPKPGETYASLIYTDRSIYRPQQSVHFKVVAYRGNYDRADFKTAPATPLTVSLLDANHQEVAKKKLKTNRFGSASGSFVIPAGRLLGRWQLRANWSGYAHIRVEEYKRPTFEAKLLDPESPLRLNRQAQLKGEARYYFGLPVTNGKVRWRVTRAPVFPWWWSYYWWRGGAVSNQAQTIDAGTATLADDGTFSIAFTPKADERGDGQTKGFSYRYAVSAEVTDEGGETRTASRSFRLGFVAVEARMNMETHFMLEDRPGVLTVTRSNLDGIADPGRGSYRIVALQSPARALLPADQPLLEMPGAKKSPAYVTPGDLLRSRWNPGYRPEAVLRGWADGAQKSKGGLIHNDEGKAEIKLPGLPAGAYRLHYKTRDAFGAQYQMSQEFMVAGTQSRLSLPAYLQVEQSSVKVGGTARILALSGLSDQPLVLDIYRDGVRRERRRLESGRDATLIEIPISEDHRGGFSVVLTALRDHQVMKFTRNLYVPWDNKELKVSFSSFRDLLRPGGKEKWTVKVSGPAGRDTPARAAEVLAYMYDRSLDTFASHNPPSPLALFPHRARAVWARTSLGGARSGWLRSHGLSTLPGYPHLGSDILRFFSGYGIGGVGKRGQLFYAVATGSTVAAAQSARSTSLDARVSDGLLANEELASAEPRDAEDRESEGGEDVNGAAAAPAPVQMRTDFSETAFFKPHLLTGQDGSVSFEFTVPDSVTSWNVWVHAITNDLESGSLKKEAKTVKDLMVRPYLPRFLREGDQAQIKVAINNASARKLTGSLDFDIIDPATERSLLADFGLTEKETRDRPFTVAAKGGTTLSFAIETPAKVGPIAFKVIARSGDFSDGELRPLPVLPGRIHLAQSRFVTLKDKTRRELHFADMARNDDDSMIHEQMVVTIDAQLFYSVLNALPYLVNYPYECTEQTLNRFVSTGILASMYKDFPAIERMAKKFASRKQQYETWNNNDPNRKMALEETPWLQMAQGGPQRSHPLINVLDPRITRAQRDASLAKLKKIQTANGSFPWFAGGPPSPYMTLYLLYGFSKSIEFGVEVPKNMTQRAWRYLHQHYIDQVVDWMMKNNCCWEFITFLNYTLSNYPDASWSGGVFSKLERKQMLDYSFSHWKEHSPYLKGYLSLTLSRADRKKDALLVWESVMDSAQTKEDQGTFWAPEDRAWLWYNDTIETHAFAIRTVMELMPKSEHLDGLVLWIFLNKKLSHWKSTRATAEVIYSLAHYLKKTAQLGLREEIRVTAGDTQKNFVFEPDEYTGKKNQIVIPGEEIDAQKHATVVVEKDTKGYAFASATWHFSTDKLPAEARGDFIQVTRKFFKRVKTGREVVLQPLKEGARIEVGDELEVQLQLVAKHPMEYIHLRDPRPAGFEPTSIVSRHHWNLGIGWYQEIRDSGTNFFLERLPQGNYPFKYRLRAAVAGTFKAAPATVQPMYAPEFTAYSCGRTITIQPSPK